MLSLRFTIAVAAALAGTAALAAPADKSSVHRDSSTGMSSGKVSMQDLHFTTRAQAVAVCDKAPITEADGKFTCSLTPDQARMANNKHPDLMK